MKPATCLASIVMVAMPLQANAQVGLGRLPNLDYAIVTANNIRVHYLPSLQDYQKSALENVAQCALVNDRESVDRVLRLKADSENYVKSLTSLASAKCLRAGSYSFQPSAFRSALFRELYKSEFKHNLPTELRNSVSYANDIGDPTTDFGKSYLVSRELADCVVVNDPANSRKLVLLKVGDRDEAKILDSLALSLEKCLPAGQTISLDKYRFTGWIAEALYRESKLAAGPDRLGGKL